MNNIFEFEVQRVEDRIDDNDNHSRVEVEPQSPYVVGDIVYLKSSEWMNTWSGETKTSWSIQRNCPTTNQSHEERESGWLGATLGDGYQTDYHSHGAWQVSSVTERVKGGYNFGEPNPIIYTVCIDRLSD